MKHLGLLFGLTSNWALKLAMLNNPTTFINININQRAFTVALLQILLIYPSKILLFLS